MFYLELTDSSGIISRLVFWVDVGCIFGPISIVNTLRPWQNGRHFADNIFKCIFLNENAWNLLKISLKFVPKVRINNIPALVQIMAGRWPGHKPSSEPMMDNLLTHICVTRLQWVKGIKNGCQHNVEVRGTEGCPRHSPKGFWSPQCTGNHS